MAETSKFEIWLVLIQKLWLRTFSASLSLCLAEGAGKEMFACMPQPGRFHQNGMFDVCIGRTKTSTDGLANQTLKKKKKKDILLHHFKCMFVFVSSVYTFSESFFSQMVLRNTPGLLGEMFRLLCWDQKIPPCSAGFMKG